MAAHKGRKIMYMPFMTEYEVKLDTPFTRRTQVIDFVWAVTVVWIFTIVMLPCLFVFACAAPFIAWKSVTRYKLRLEGVLYLRHVLREQGGWFSDWR
ncbi:hypothetical protein [Marinivivus vitaminiproducens]|uniref:hypothetical protein n=1 Tax=Marinivivus vitaminiproducens TaxID=3035935 RepID=UPI00279B150B|nr:hypothetical protein P4R82_10090 [Geminicoccaceae bacterium SCSIO 64248]